MRQYQLVLVLLTVLAVNRVQALRTQSWSDALTHQVVAASPDDYGTFTMGGASTGGVYWGNGILYNRGGTDWMLIPYNRTVSPYGTAWDTYTQETMIWGGSDFDDYLTDAEWGVSSSRSTPCLSCSQTLQSNRHSLYASGVAKGVQSYQPNGGYYLQQLSGYPNSLPRGFVIKSDSGIVTWSFGIYAASSDAANVGSRIDKIKVDPNDAQSIYFLGETASDAAWFTWSIDSWNGPANTNISYLPIYSPTSDPADKRVIIGRVNAADGKLIWAVATDFTQTGSVRYVTATDIAVSVPSVAHPQSLVYVVGYLSFGHPDGTPGATGIASSVGSTDNGFLLILDASSGDPAASSLTQYPVRLKAVAMTHADEVWLLGEFTGVITMGIYTMSAGYLDYDLVLFRVDDAGATTLAFHGKGLYADSAVGLIVTPYSTDVLAVGNMISPYIDWAESARTMGSSIASLYGSKFITNNNNDQSSDIWIVAVKTGTTDLWAGQGGGRGQDSITSLSYDSETDIAWITGSNSANAKFDSFSTSSSGTYVIGMSLGGGQVYPQPASDLTTFAFSCCAPTNSGGGNYDPPRHNPSSSGSSFIGIFLGSFFGGFFVLSCLMIVLVRWLKKQNDARKQREEQAMRDKIRKEEQAKIELEERTRRDERAKIEAEQARNRQLMQPQALGPAVYTPGGQPQTSPQYAQAMPPQGQQPMMAIPVNQQPQQPMMAIPVGSSPQPQYAQAVGQQPQYAQTNAPSGSQPQYAQPVDPGGPQPQYSQQPPQYAQSQAPVYYVPGAVPYGAPPQPQSTDAQQTSGAPTATQPIQYAQPAQYAQAAQSVQYAQPAQPLQYSQSPQPMQYAQAGQPVYAQQGQYAPVQYAQPAAGQAYAVPAGQPQVQYVQQPAVPGYSPQYAYAAQAGQPAAPPSYQPSGAQ